MVATALGFEVPCFVVKNSSNHCQWCFGICIADNNDGTYIIHHSDRCDRVGDNSPGTEWKYPTHPYRQNVSCVIIILCNMVRSWDFSRRVTNFLLEIHHTIKVFLSRFVYEQINATGQLAMEISTQVNCPHMLNS